MSKYKIKNPNRQFNDWDAVEGQIERLDKKIDEAVLGQQSFSNIQGDPYDNTALSEALDEKADVGDSYTKAEDDALLNLKADKSDTYTKTEVDTLLDDKADIGDSYTKAEDDALLDNKVDKETGKELMPSTLPDRVTQNEIDIQDLKDDKQDLMQFEVMPSAEEYLGKIVQYVGPTNTDYTNGFFYQADYDSETLTYKWVEKLSGGGAQYTAGQGIEITDNEIKCTLLNDTITSTTTTWSSQKLRQEFEAIAGATKVYVVATLPTIGELNSIYYQGTEAPYNIYLYTSDNQWVFIGTTGVNLQNYYTKTEIDSLLNVIRNDILDNKPVAGNGIAIDNLPSHGGKSIRASVKAPLTVGADGIGLAYGWGLQVDSNTLHAKTVDPIDRDANGIKLNYNEGLDVNSNNELKVNYGAGLKLNGSNNTIEPDVDNNTVVLDSNDKISVPLKTINNQDLHGTGNITIQASSSPTIIGEITINTQSGQTICNLTENINNYNQILIKISSNYADMGSLVLLKPSGSNGWVQGSSHWYTYQNSLLLIAQNSIYNYYGNFYCTSNTQLSFTEIHSVIMNYATGAITYSSPVGFTISVYGI